MDDLQRIEKVHDTLGDGSFKGCLDNIDAKNPGCARCCESGSFLFPGEDEYLLGVKTREEWLQEGVEIYSDRVKGCVGRTEDGGKFCKLGKDKTVNCKIYPEIVWVTDGPNSGDPAFVDIHAQTDSCPAAGKSKDKDWERRVRRAKKLLKKYEGRGKVILPKCANIMTQHRLFALLDELGIPRG